MDYLPTVTGWEFSQAMCDKFKCHQVQTALEHLISLHRLRHTDAELLRHSAPSSPSRVFPEHGWHLLINFCPGSMVWILYCAPQLPAVNANLSPLLKYHPTMEFSRGKLNSHHKDQPNNSSLAVSWFPEAKMVQFAGKHVYRKRDNLWQQLFECKKTNNNGWMVMVEPNGSVQRDCAANRNSSASFWREATRNFRETCRGDIAGSVRPSKWTKYGCNETGLKETCKIHKPVQTADMKRDHDRADDCFFCHLVFFVWPHLLWFRVFCRDLVKSDARIFQAVASTRIFHRYPDLKSSFHPLLPHWVASKIASSTFQFSVRMVGLGNCKFLMGGGWLGQKMHLVRFLYQLTCFHDATPSLQVFHFAPQGMNAVIILLFYIRPEKCKLQFSMFDRETCKLQSLTTHLESLGNSNLCWAYCGAV